MTTFLVTGGAGFIGSNFVHHLFHKYRDAHIIVLDLLTYAGSVDNLPLDYRSANGNGGGRVEFWYGDVRNASLVESLVRRCDVVVHFAAETHVTRSIFDNYHFFETDVLGTQVIANAVLHSADRIKVFIHVSTSEVYGTARTEVMDEEHPLMPLSPYASAKAGADRLVYSYWATYNLPAVIVRPFNNYGPRQHLEKAVPRFVTSCLLDEPLRVHGDGSAQRDWIYVDDTCAAIDAIMNADPKLVVGEVLNIGTGMSLTIAEIARRIVRHMNKPEDLITYVGERPGQVFRHTCDASKVRRLLGWEAKVDFAEGLERTAAWYCRQRGAWEKQLWMREIPIKTQSGKHELH
ncbi:MAG TPA: GDP-mannose 4,6-dehydratase [Vicinamibacterales bacterium]|jgi:dTDP-glucose 4,6-dehydratase|nr:GDP-mannose 4,6-dehydratase [Vicinamibacterales bacterium]